ncbi:MAG: hypothetical protein KA792_02535 [Bacteroidales bacterium]|nr:hypothetical protein [Bacteroidales bacterium]
MSPINVLICPLNWGLGHSTRSVPLINNLLQNNCNVIIAADKEPLSFLREEFPALQFYVFTSAVVKYPSGSSMSLKMLLSLPRFIINIIKEHYILKRIINKYDIKLVISDNRYGVWNKSVYSVFITHQIFIKAPKFLKWIEPIIEKINKYFISRYAECWIPDFIDYEKNLSGELSHKKPLPANCHFINPLSRFVSLDKNKSRANNLLSTENNKTDILFILSGPEPQRSIFENIILKDVKMHSSLKIALVKGKINTEARSINKINIEKPIDNFIIYSHLNSNALFELINKAELVICRPGYSSIMDLCLLGKKAVFVPTPGQTEQEYLADYYKMKGFYYSLKQDSFNINDAINKSKNFNGLKLHYNEDLLQQRLNYIINNIN